MLFHPIVAASVAFLVACSGSDSPVDAINGQDAIGDVPVDPDAHDAVQDTTGDTEPGDIDPSDGSDVNDVQDPDVTPFQDGAVAFVSTLAEDMIAGPLAAGVPGDIVLKNRHVRFVVRNQERSLYSSFGGALVDADVVRPDGEAGQDHFFEVFPMVGIGRVFRPTSMEIVDDGTYSGTATVRFTGTDGGMTLIDSILPTDPLLIEVTTDYVLGPDARHIEIVTTVRNPFEWPTSLVIGQFMQFGDRLTKFYEACGQDQKCLSSSSGTGWLAAETGTVSYGYGVPSGRNISLILAKDELLLLQAGFFDLAAGEEVAVRQFFAVGDGTIEDVVTTLRELREEAPGTAVPINVTLGDDNSSMADARIRIRRSGAPDRTAWVTATGPESDGSALVRLAPGTYDFLLSLPGAPEVTAADVVIGETEAEPVLLNANPAGRLRVRVTDNDAQPMTASLALQAGHDAAWGARVVHYEAIRDGDYNIPMAAGNYTATVSRGLVWGIDRKNITVVAGEIAELEARIQQEVDTTGHLMMNTHEHCERSIDSSVLVEDRVYNAVAVGIDIMNPTDHDFFGTHEGTILSLGLQEQVHSFLGCEVSPLWGHTTATGCLTPPEYDTYFAVDYTLYDETGAVVRGLTATEIYDQARNRFGCEFIAVNHPYRGGPTFDTYGITDTSNPADALPDFDLTLVDAVEVYNKGDSLETIMTQNVPAWFNLLNRGYRIAAIGGSDEHGYGGNYGNPRNMVPSSKTVAEGIVQSEIFGNVKAFRNVVVGGPLIDLTVDGKGLGEIATAVGGKVEVRVRVTAPSWMGLEFIRVFANGQMVQEFDPADTQEVVRLDETFELDVDTDAHIVVMAGSTLNNHQMVPVSAKHPFSITNPVFVDVDGGGYKAIHKDGAPWDDGV
jgi:hypothetical protein